MQKPFSDDEAHGVLIGLALGDALGVEREEREAYETAGAALAEAGGDSFGCSGSWSGVTSLALCVAQMLRSANGWDAEDAMRRFVNWRDFGYLASPGRTNDADARTVAALAAFCLQGNPYAGSDDGDGASGGAMLARVAPVAVAYGAVKESAMAVAQLQARLTHADRPSQTGAANLAELLVTGARDRMPRPGSPPEQVTDHVRDVLHAAFWSLSQAECFAGAVRAAVDLGGAARVTGAVTGMLAGRFHGYAGIPKAWREALRDHDKILVIADDLHAMRPIDI